MAPDNSDTLDRHLASQADPIKEVHGEVDALLRVGLATAESLYATRARRRERQDRALASAIKANMLSDAQEAARRLGTDGASLGDLLSVGAGAMAVPGGTGAGTPLREVQGQGTGLIAEHKVLGIER